jgi:hypothetical protein
MIAEGSTAKTSKDRAKPIPYSAKKRKKSFIKFIAIDLTITNIYNPIEIFFNDNFYSNK